MNRGIRGVRADKGRSYADIEKMAARLRRSLGYSLLDLINGEVLFEQLPKKVRLSIGDRSIPLQTGIEALDAPTEGFTKYNTDQRQMEIMVSDETYRGLLTNRPHCLYCLGHELGHCVLHAAQLARLAKLPMSGQIAFHRGLKDHDPYLDTEWQANAFAGAVLMPARGIEILERKITHRAFLAPKITEIYGVSAEAALYRVQNYRSRKLALLKAH